MTFRFAFADDAGSVYAVGDQGDLFYYRDLARDGTGNWAFGGVGQKIGSGWANFRHVFSGGDGVIYAINSDGDLFYYRDLARNGTGNWAFGGVGQKIGNGWANFRQVFSGGDGVIYAINSDGDLFYYRDLARNGTGNWAFGGVGQKIGNGWKFRQVFSDFSGAIYAIASTGDLFFYRDESRNGALGWSFNGIGQRIGRGWAGFWTVFSGGAGIIYAVTTSGDLLFYRDEARNGTMRWSFGGIGQKIGSEWIPSLLEGYCWPLSAAPGETIDFMISSSSSFQMSYVRLSAQTEGEAGFVVSGWSVPGRGFPTVELQPSVQTTSPNWVSDGCGWTATFSLTVPGEWRSGIYAAQCSDGNSNFYIVFIVKPENAQRKILALASTNTWSAYNTWGGYSKYGPATPLSLTFLRPNHATTPIDDGSINHLTRADLWILNWIEEAGQELDVIADVDLHNGFAEITHYSALILTTRPEYWSLEMVDHLQDQLRNGGSVLYLGGNGMFERCIFNSATTALTFFEGNPSLERAPAFLRNLNPPRSERAVLGVAFRFDYSWGDPPSWNASPYQVRMAGHPLLTGTGLNDGDLIGETGRQGNNGGGASGWEMDTSNVGTEPDDGVIVAASVGSDRGAPPSESAVVGARHELANSRVRYDILCETGSGGFVFSVGSICFGGSLVQDSHLQIILQNALNKGVGTN